MNSKTKTQNSKPQLKTKKYSLTQPGITKIELREPGRYIVELNKEGSEAEVKGVFVGRDNQQVNVKIEIIHKAPHTRAKTTLKGAAYDQSQVKFAGKIVIVPDCPDTNSFLTERILLLSDHAKAEAVPDLEIESDDVKCSHAATISKIPDEQLFYLMSRGLDRKLAEELIVEGFLED